MDTTTPGGRVDLPPNHHADHAGFAGLTGLVAALGFARGRTADAELAARLTGIGPDDVVVDVGCGPGTAVRRAAAAGVASVVGVDPAPVMLRTARVLTWPRGGRRGRLRYVQGSAEALPLPDASATIVWSLATVHHWHDIAAGLAEDRRVLRPPARFLVLERPVAPGASGHASHGWTDDQAERFAERCGAFGFRAEVGRHTVPRCDLLSVLATM